MMDPEEVERLRAEIERLRSENEALRGKRGRKSAKRGYGHGTVYQRGSKWWIRFYRDGTPFAESAGDSEAEAREKLRARLAEVWQGDFEGFEPERKTVGDLLDEYVRQLKLEGAKSMGPISCHVATVREALGKVEAVKLTRGQIDTYIEKRLADPSPRRPGQTIAPATVNRETEVLRAALNLAVKDRLLKFAPYVRKLAENNARQVYFTPAEFEAFLPHLEPEGLRAAAEFAYYTGWRQGVVLGLPWSRVEWNAEPYPRVLLEEGVAKEGDARSVPLVGRLLALMKRQLRARIAKRSDGTKVVSALVFHDGAGGELIPRVPWGKALEAAGLSGKTWHDLKRSANSNMTNAGNAQARVMAVTGHKTDVMFRRYLMTGAEDKAEVLERTFRHLDAQRQKRSAVSRRRKRVA